MPYKRAKPRNRYQSINFVAGWLKDIIEIEKSKKQKANSRIILECVDRFIEMDRIIDLDKFRGPKTSIPVTIPEPQIEEDIVEEAQAISSVDANLEELRKKVNGESKAEPATE